MRMFLLPVLAFGVAVLGSIGIANGAGACRGSRIYTHCSDDMVFLRGQCSAYPIDSAVYAGCMVNADQDVKYSCQAYRVPCSYEGSILDAFSLLQYPKVGAPTPLRPGYAPVGDQTPAVR